MPTANIQPGTPATYSIGGDRYAGTIVESRRNNRELVWEGDGLQNVFTLRRSGKYFLKGKDYGSLNVGDDSPTQLDPSF